MTPHAGRVAVLPRSFYARDAATVARALLGCILVQRGPDGRARRAWITETEAYVGTHDLASHSSKGRTRRNATMFGPPGRAYVYLVYGMHHCLNVVTGTGEDDAGQAVLLRAAEPLGDWPEGTNLRGPGRLARAFGLTLADDGADLVRGPGRLRIHAGRGPEAVEATARIGVDYAADWAAAPLRFTDAASPHVSRRPASRVR